MVYKIHFHDFHLHKIIYLCLWNIDTYIKLNVI